MWSRFVGDEGCSNHAIMEPYGWNDSAFRTLRVQLYLELTLEFFRINGAALLSSLCLLSLSGQSFFFLSHDSNRKEVKYCTGGFHGSDNLFTNMQVRTPHCYIIQHHNQWTTGASRCCSVLFVVLLNYSHIRIWSFIFSMLKYVPYQMEVSVVISLLWKTKEIPPGCCVVL